MSADNVALLFILLLSFMAVCQSDEDISVSCADVTGFVGKEVTLTCSVSLQNIECCITMYMFHYPKSFNDSAICPQEFPMNPCEQRNSFTCRYTPTTAMTEQFRFYLQTKCGFKRTEFTVDLTETLKHETDTEAPGEKGIGTEAFIITGVSGFIFIIIVIAIICVRRFKSTNPSGLQKKYERSISEEQTVMTTNI